jgi:hypothetical protein
MSIHQIPARVVVFEGTEPRFPGSAEVHAVLAPKELFGLEPLSGRLNSTPVGVRVMPQADLFTKTIHFTQEGKMAHWSVSANWCGMAFELKDGVVVLRFEAQTLESFLTNMTFILAWLAPTVASATRDAVWLTDAYGLVGSSAFTVKALGNSERGFHAESANSLANRLTAQLELFSKIADPAGKFLAAHRYLIQARRLRQVASYRGEFAAEELLNLNKAVEVLLDVDELRSFAKDSGWPEDLTEVLASLAYVRSVIDVAHPATKGFSPDEYQLMQDFAVQAEAAVSIMLKWMSEGVAAGKMQLIGPAQDKKERLAETDRSTKRKRTIACMLERKDALFRPLDPNPVTRRSSMPDAQPKG